MAQIQDRKSNFYRQKQSVRDELSAPQYLESAGDELIKYLVKKQSNTSTSLQEQLEVVQNFEKGFELNPDNRKGISSLEDFKKHVQTQEESFTSPTKREEIRDLDEMMRIAGLSRHELELGLCEKPSSKVSQLYLFAIGNKCQKAKRETLENKLLDHPLHHLKEIEEECFGHVKKLKRKIKPMRTDDYSHSNERKPKACRKKKRQRRKKKVVEITTDYISTAFEPAVEPQKTTISEKNEENIRPTTSRPSLWDVKDMKKWSEAEEVACKPQAFYTIKNGKIIKLEKESGREDTT